MVALTASHTKQFLKGKEKRSQQAPTKTYTFYSKIIQKMPEKFIGYILLILGLVIIVASALNIYQVFILSKQPLQIFNFNSVSMSASDITGVELPSNQNPQLELFSADMLNKPLNLMSQLFLMGFMASIGYKIASLGIQLMRLYPPQTKSASGT